MQTGKVKAAFVALLALVGVMAVSASAAQANWQLLKNGSAVSSLNIEGKSSEDGSLLVSNGIQIDCTESEGSASISGGGTPTVTGKATVTFKGCEEATFGEVCETKSAGQPDGTIVASGTGTAGMVSAEEVYLLSLKSNEQFTVVQFVGEECPLVEVDGTITGHVKISALEALKDQKLHSVHFEAQNLSFWGENAEIDNETGGHVILGSITEATGATFAAHLIGL